MSLFVVNSLKKYEVNGQVCPVISAGATHTAGNDRTIVAAATGKRHRIMGYVAQSAAAGATSGFVIKAAAAGRALNALTEAPASGAGLPFVLAISDAGYDESDTGAALVVDVYVSSLNLTVYYITYTP